MGLRCVWSVVVMTRVLLTHEGYHEATSDDKNGFKATISFRYMHLQTSSDHINGSVQERHNSIANALELRLSCTNPLISSGADPSFQSPVSGHNLLLFVSQ